MVPERSRRRRRLATLVVRTSAQGAIDTETWTSRGERVLTLPTEQATRPGAATATDTANATMARQLLAHAHRARHLLADRAVLANVQSTRRVELMQEIQRMRGVMRTLEEQIEVTTRSLEAMERLVAHLQRVTDLVREAGVLPTVTRDAPAAAAAAAEASTITASTTSAL
ncbi:hypothetical protein V7S43_018461 [Phytophthora oleae]|uniref:Biogenesis of lysosome-related organelles complex 1 subunit 3 n=1 Tax=Phytophthora oleae TaxID=2107226 RepID=A0ABD3ETT8_9STRA